jgi:hypothetical protein
MMKIYYMRDNHTFLPLPLDVGVSESLLRQEFDDGHTCGMLCSKDPKMRDLLHARGSDQSEQFFQDARKWVQRAIDLSR